MMILLKLLPLIPLAHALLWAMLAIGLWLCRDLIASRVSSGSVQLGQAARRPAVAVRRLRWKLAVLSGLAATELVVCLVGVTAM
jgi:hypothetical protein